tara:strand:- start:953 stop:1735 length:783 start_codon:yes stop_codon:yes gene_type:complete
MANVPGITNLKMGGGVPSELFGNLSQSNFYEVYITTDWSSEEGMKKFLKNSDVQKSYNLDENFVTRNLGLLCSDAVLPASAFATSEVKDNFMGVNQEFAHTRLYTDIDLTFYVDNDYRSLGFFEAWMNYIAGGGQRSLTSFESGYYRRLNYPDFYKHNGIYIRKFERDYKESDKNKYKNIIYRLRNAFPKSMNSIPISYGGAEIVKVNVTFTYDYYSVVRGSDYELTELGSFSDPDSILSRAAEVVAPVDDLVDYARSLI